MEQIKKNPSKVKNVVFLWELEPTVQLLDGVVLAALENNSTAIMENHDHTENTTDPDKSDLGICDRMFCLTCSTEFDERDEQREHFKSDWHRFNLKRKLKGQEIVSELKFEEITNAGDLSSISGSESSGDETDQSLSEHHMEDEGQGHIEGIGKRHPRVFLRNSKGELLSIYRCVIHGKRSQVDTPQALVTMVREVPQEMMWLIIMLAGGHFAAAVFRGNTVVEHKTFHRYVIRAKRGTVQSSRDNKGQAPKSGGATLRRYNEAALAKDVQDLLSSWSEYVKTTHRIFIRAPTYCKSTFYGGKNPVLDKRDPRIRLIPFQTRRPTLKEVHRVHRLLASAECYGTDSSLDDHIKSSPKKLLPVDVTPSSEVKRSPQPSSDLRESTGLCLSNSDISDSGDIETVFTMEQLDTTVLQTYQATKKAKRKNKAAINHQSLDCDVTQLQKSTDPETITLRNDLYTACKTKNTVQLRTLLDGVKSRTAKTIQASSQAESDLLIVKSDTQKSVETISSRDTVGDSLQMMNGTNELDIVELLNSPFGGHGLTLLHIAAEAGHKEAISVLLEFGADPSIKDGQGQLAYITAVNKDTRNEFRRFMAKHPEKFDYQKAQIPGPLSEEQEKEKKAKEAERKKMLKKAKKERMKDQKLQEAKEREEDEERKRYLGLSDREKRALAAEKRLTVQALASGQTPPIFSRCFQCALDITGKIPFEYAEYKFCSTKCLKQHRTEKSLKKS